MRIKIERGELLLALQRVQGLIEKKSTIPILSNILIDAGQKGNDEKDFIYIIATDLDIGIRGRYKAEVIEEGKITISAKKLYEITRNTDEKELSIMINPDTNGQVIVEAGRGVFKIMGLPPEDYPDTMFDPSEIRGIKIPTSILSSLIRRTIFAVGSDTSRKIFTGVFLRNYKRDDEGGMICLIGTDTNRLAITERRIDDNTEIEMVIPKRVVSEIRRLLLEDREDKEDEIVELGIGKNIIRFKKGEMVVISRILEEEDYPNCKEFIPVNDKRLIVSRVDFEKVIKRVSIFSYEKTMAINLDILPDKRMILSSNSPEIGEAREELSVRYDGEGIMLRMNARYLLECLNVIEGEEIIMEIKDNEGACLIRGDENKDEGYIYVVMPMRLSV